MVWGREGVPSFLDAPPLIAWFHISSYLEREGTPLQEFVSHLKLSQERGDTSQRVHATSTRLGHHSN